MARKTDIGSSNAQYTRSYGDLRGVDFSSDPAQVSPARPTYLVNMYRDYDSEHGAAIETIPGYRRLFHFGGTIHGIWGYSSSQDERGETCVVVHAGTKLFTFKMSERDGGRYEERFNGLRDSDSTAFLQNNNFYICDGACIYVMKSDFCVSSIIDEAYVPITYLHGAPYEQRNMIGCKFINRDTVTGQSYVLPNIKSYTYGNDEQNISGSTYLENNEAEAYIVAWLSQFSYEKEESGRKIIYKIKGYAGSEVDELTLISNVARCEDDRYIIYQWVKNGGTGGDICYTVEFDVEFRKKIKRIIAGGQVWEEEYQEWTQDWTSDYEGGEEYPVGDPYWKTLYRVKKGYTEEMWRELFPNVEEIYEYNGVGGIPMKGYYHARATIYDPCEQVLSVKLKEQEVQRYSKEMESVPDIFWLPVSQEVKERGGAEWYVSYIDLYAKRQGDLEGIMVDISGVAKETMFQTAAQVESIHTDYITANTEYKGTSEEAIIGCGISTTFDGRVFLTGNPKLPNTVFYSCRDLTGYNNPTYWGVYNYFNDGEGNEPNVALLATSNVLMVLKRGTLQGSAIYYHVGADGLDDVVPRIYPSTPGVAGLGCEGAAINFLDDAVFISERGLEGVSKEQLNLERTIGHRSSNVDRLLRQCDLKGAKMCRFAGYLCIFTGDGKVFLGDSKQMFQGIDGAAEYEWYYLDGVGDREGDYALHRTVTQFPELFRNDIPEGYTLEGAKLLGQPLLIDDTARDISQDALYTGEAEIVLAGRSCSITVQYTDREGAYILCSADGERAGGVFSPACIGAAIDGVLFFGTKGGGLLCFNTDKRGEAVGIDAVEAEEIHRSWYTFGGHRYLSGLILKSDNCGVPHLTKRTTRKTCVAKLKTMPGSSISVKIRTDRDPWHEVTTSLAATAFDFSDMEFDNFSFALDSDTIVTIKDKEKKWVEKQFHLYSDGWCRPFGLHSLTFNYEIQGRVKK